MKRCEKCGKSHEEAIEVCDCGSDSFSDSDHAETPSAKGADAPAGYGFRDVILILCQLLVWVSVIGGLVAVCFAMFQRQSFEPMLVFQWAISSVVAIGISYVFEAARRFLQWHDRNR